MGLKFYLYPIYSIPPFLLYKLSDFISYLLLHFFKYRFDVAMQNLDRVFPELSTADKKKILRSFYLNFTDTIVESLMLFNFTEKDIDDRIRIVNPEVINQLAQKGISGLALSGHICNWEWTGIALGRVSQATNVAVYLPLKNKSADDFIRDSRIRLTRVDYLVGSSELYKTLLKAPQPVWTYMVADQSPTRNSHIRVNFFNTSTPFFNGPARICKKLDMALLYLDVRRVSRGKYEGILRQLALPHENISEHELCQRYASALEDTIRKSPSDWLWTHKRWKF